MRRGLTWLVAVPLLVAGSQAAHVLTYRLVYPGTPIRVRALVVTGHGYLDRLPLALGVALAITVVALLVAALDASRGHRARALPALGVRRARAARLRPPGGHRAVAAHGHVRVARGRGPDVPARPRAPAAVLAARLARGPPPAPGGEPCRPRARRPAARGRPLSFVPRPRAGRRCLGPGRSPTASQSEAPLFASPCDAGRTRARVRSDRSDEGERNMTTWSRITAFALTALPALVATGAAFAHAQVSPPVVLAKAGRCSRSPSRPRRRARPRPRSS